MTLTADGKTAKDSTLVERWLEDQREWQRTAMAYLDSMVKNEDFLVHLGNAMRGSLLAGKPYPAAAPAGQPAAQEAPADDRLDQVLFALHQIQGQLTDLRMTLDDAAQQREGVAVRRGQRHVRKRRPRSARAEAPRTRPPRARSHARARPRSRG